MSKADLFFKICLVSGFAMLVCLVIFLCIPCWPTAIPFLTTKLICIISGLLSNILNKEGGKGNGKYN